MKVFTATINSELLICGLYLEFTTKYRRSVYCSVKHVIEGNKEGRTKVTGRQGRRLEQLLDDLKEKRGYWQLKEEALDHTLWRTRFGRGCGPAIRQTLE